MGIQDRTTTTTSQRALNLRRWSLLWRIAPALGVFFLAPLTAEYLIGYDTSTGNFGDLLFGLTFFAPLYGGAALIVREVARRSRRGWVTIILLALGFGVLQAGLVDHSLFNPSYRDISYWQAMLGPTYIPALGMGVDPALDFVLGHAIWSISVPIAIVETLVPGRRTTPWLGKFGLTTIVVLYLLVSALIFLDHVETEQFLPSAPQLIGAAVVVAAFVGAAFIVGARPRPQVDYPAPNPWLVGVVGFVTLSLPDIAEVVFALLGVAASFDASWWDVALSSALVAVLAIAVTRWSQREGWAATHRLALAGGALLSHVWLAFLVEPLGDVALYDKLIHNAVFALGALVLLGAAARAANRTQEGGAPRNCSTIDLTGLS